MMPGMSGIETYIELKKIDAHCLIVMMSSHSDSGEWMKAEDLSVELLSKPLLGPALTRVLLRATSG
jgi:DNA-binding NarL/FixJ family response regulator